MLHLWHPPIKWYHTLFNDLNPEKDGFLNQVDDGPWSTTECTTNTHVAVRYVDIHFNKCRKWISPTRTREIGTRDNSWSLTTVLPPFYSYRYVLVLYGRIRIFRHHHQFQDVFMDNPFRIYQQSVCVLLLIDLSTQKRSEFKYHPCNCLYIKVLFDDILLSRIIYMIYSRDRISNVQKKVVLCFSLSVCIV